MPPTTSTQAIVAEATAHPVCAAMFLGGLLCVAVGALQRPYLADEYTQHVTTGGQVIKAEIDAKTHRGVLSVAYQIKSGGCMAVRDFVTDNLSCVERERFLLRWRQKDPWPVVRYNPTDPTRATLQDETPNPWRQGLIIPGIVLAIGGAACLGLSARRHPR